MTDRFTRASCPDDAELRMFDVGMLPWPEVERISEHMARCAQCSTSLSQHVLEDVVLMASFVTPGQSLLCEPEYERMRHELLGHPEMVVAEHLDRAEHAPPWDRLASLQ